MKQMIWLAPAPPGSVPFTRTADGMAFDGQDSRPIEFGHAFDQERGYRVYFKFKDSPASNTWGGSSLLEWADQLVPGADAAVARLQVDCRRLAKQVISLNLEWERQGRPTGGIVEREGGHA